MRFETSLINSNDKKATSTEVAFCDVRNFNFHISYMIISGILQALELNL